nr:unnamed protein product [Naegleria fowleri]
MQRTIKSILALALFTVLVLCFTTKTAFAQQQEQVLADLQLFADQLMMSDMSHPRFDEHLEMVLADMASYNFDIEADDELLNYISTLSDAEAMALAKSSAKFRRFFRRVGRFVRKAGRVIGKVAKIAVPIALTVFSGGAGAPVLGSVGGAIAKGAAFLGKASSIIGKGQAILGGLNAVTGGKSKFLNKSLGFLNKVGGVIGKGQMFLGRGADIVSGLKGLSGNLKSLGGLKGIVSNFKPSQLFKGANIFQKGQNFLNKASGLIGKGQKVFQNLNLITGGKSKFVNKGLTFLDKANTFTGIGKDALSGIQGGVNSLKKLKNLRGQDLRKMLTSGGLQKFLGRADNAIGKTQDILQRVNDVTGGKSKRLNKILGALEKGRGFIQGGNQAISSFRDFRASLKNLKGVRGIDGAIQGAQSVLNNGQNFIGSLNQLTGGRSKRLNKLQQALGKGQQFLDRGAQIVNGVKGVRQTIKNMDPNLFRNFFLKNENGKLQVNQQGITHFLGKMQQVLGTGRDVFENLNQVTGGKNKFINKALQVLQTGQNGVEQGQEAIQKAHDIWQAVENVAHTMRTSLEQPVQEQQPQEQPQEQPTETPVQEAQQPTEAPVSEVPSEQAQPDLEPNEQVPQNVEPAAAG